MRDPEGVQRRALPRLLTIIADMNEKWELICLYGSGCANLPCPACTDTKKYMQQKIAKIVEGKRCVDSR